MAVTALGRNLTEAHRQAQARIVTATFRDLLAVWPLLDPHAVDSTWLGYERAARALIASHRADSAHLAAAYLQAFREAEGVAGAPVQAALSLDAPAEQVETSLRVTGPVTVKVATRGGKTPEQAAQVAFAQTFDAVSRLVLGGSRDTIEGTVRRDRHAFGVARVTDGSPCAFCAMLASRGPVYKSEGSADFRPHGKCGCQPEPVYAVGDAYEWPGRAIEFRSLWDESTQHASNRDAVNAFRRAYERPSA